jgi:hypothetical protein
VYSTAYEVTEAPIMQYLEHGSIRNDAMPPVAGAGEKKQGVFNAEVVAILARHGYNKTVPGGRSQPNMSRDRFGPRGTVTKDQP